jgi:hypothetical protein
LYDNVDYAPTAGDLDRPGLFDGCACWGSWYIVGDLGRLGIDADSFCQHHPLQWDDTTLGSLSPLHRNGIAARMVSRSLSPINEAFTQLWQTIRTSYMGLPAGALRK